MDQDLKKKKKLLLFCPTDLMAPDESDGIRTSNDVTVEIDIDPFADVVAFQVATQFQSDAWNICNKTNTNAKLHNAHRTRTRTVHTNKQVNNKIQIHST